MQNAHHRLGNYGTGTLVSEKPQRGLQDVWIRLQAYWRGPALATPG
jgi:hypothetical protein